MDYWRPPTWTSSSSTTPERGNVSGLSTKQAVSITGECAFGKITMWLQHNGAPAHFRINVAEISRTSFPNVGYDMKALCMAFSITRFKSPGFLLWGHLKSIVHGEPVPDVQTLQKRVYEACDPIRTQPGTFERLRQSMMRRVHAWIASHGGHSNICCDIDGIQAMFSVLGLFD